MVRYKEPLLCLYKQYKQPRVVSGIFGRYPLIALGTRNGALSENGNMIWIDLYEIKCPEIKVRTQICLVHIFDILYISYTNHNHLLSDIYLMCTEQKIMLNL